MEALYQRLNIKLPQNTAMKQVLNILLIEDDLIERMKFKKVLEEIEPLHQISEAKNGEEAINHLQEARNNLPDIIILDLNMPKLNGIEFLSYLKSDPEYKFLPVVVLTTSRNKFDTKECFRIGISGYLLKPLLYPDYVEQIKSLMDYWSRNELIKLNA